MGSRFLTETLQAWELSPISIPGIAIPIPGVALEVGIAAMVASVHGISILVITVTMLIGSMARLMVLLCERTGLW